MTTPTASCKNMKPKIPEDLPKGYYFRVWPSSDSRGRKIITVTLYRERAFWFDKRVNEDDFCAESAWLGHRDAKQYVESTMRSLTKDLLANLHNEKYLYGRHP